MDCVNFEEWSRSSGERETSSLISLNGADSKSTLVEKVLEKMEKEPPCGTSAWWDYSEKRADAEIKMGKYKTFENGEEYLKYLKTL